MAGIIVCLWFVWTRFWAAWDHIDSFFGGDLTAYLNGAHRLIATGSPYHEDLHAGPIANAIENVPIGYLYPPPLAQVFTVIRGVPRDVLALANATLQFAGLSILLPLLYRKSSGRLTAGSLGTILCAAILFFPLNMALFGGNLSGWIAIGVAVALLSPVAIGPVAAIATLAKLTPAVLAVPALLEQRSRRQMLGVGAVVLLTSVTIAPWAWWDWLAVLPNVVQFPMSTSPYNLSLASLLSSVGLQTAGAVAGFAIGALSAAWSAWLARGGRHAASVAAAVMALLLIPATMYDHYLAATFVVAVFAWPLAAVAGRALLLASYAVGLVMWVPGLVPDSRPFLILGIIAASVTTVHALARIEAAESSVRNTGPTRLT